MCRTEEPMWTFLEVEGMPVTNNLAERRLGRAGHGPRFAAMSGRPVTASSAARPARAAGLALVVILASAAAVHGAQRLFLPVAVRHAPVLGVDLRLVGQAGGDARAVVVEGRHGWAGIGPRVVAFWVAADDRLRRVGASDVLPGVVVDLALRGDELYAVVRGGRLVLGMRPDEGLVVFDAAGDGVPRLVAQVPALGSGLAHVAAVPAGVFVADESGRIWGVDVQDPLTPRVASQVELPGLGERQVWGLVGGSAHVYVLYVDERWPDPSLLSLAVLDAADVSNPTLVGSVAVAEDPFGPDVGSLALDGDRLYALRSDPVVWSLADPAHPTVLLDDLPAVNTATVAEGRLYAMADLGAVVIADVVDPMSVTLLGGAHLGIDASRLAVGDGFVFGVGGGVAAVDARDPASAANAGRCLAPGVWARDVGVARSALFVPEGAGLWSWADRARLDAGCAQRIPLLDSDPDGMVGPHLGPIAVSGSRAFVGEVGSSPAGVWVLDLSDPQGPRIGGRSADLPLLLDVAAEADYAFALSERGVHVIDGRHVDAPVLRSSVQLIEQTVWWTAGVAVDGGFLAAAGPALQLLDTSEPERPQAIASLEPTEARDVAVRGDLVFVSGPCVGGCVHGGLHVFDATDRRAPRLVAAVCRRSTGPLAATEAPAQLGEGSLVFVGDAVATPSTSPALWVYYVPQGGRVPVPLASAPLPANPEGLAVSEDGTEVWVADAAGGVFGYEVRVSGLGP
jgi:hypothetical protein